MSFGGITHYDMLAQMHRPTDPEALRQEVNRLATSQGLTAADLATALRINLAQVREMLAASGEEATQLHRNAWRS